MLLLALAVAASPAPHPFPMQWASFGRSGALSHVTESVDVATGDRKDTGQFQYKLRFTMESIGNPPETKWADSINCPAVRSVIISMHDLPMPTILPPGGPWAPHPLIADGTAYFLTAPSSFSMGEATISSNVGSPLAQWVDGALERLKPCWKDSDG